MKPEHQKRLDDLMSRPMGLPAARDLANTMKRQTRPVRRSATRWEWEPVDDSSRPERVFGLIFIAALCSVGLWLVAVLT